MTSLLDVNADEGQDVDKAAHFDDRNKVNVRVHDRGDLDVDPHEESDDNFQESNDGNSVNRVSNVVMIS